MPGIPLTTPVSNELCCRAGVLVIEVRLSLSISSTALAECSRENPVNSLFCMGHWHHTSLTRCIVIFQSLDLEADFTLHLCWTLIVFVTYLLITLLINFKRCTNAAGRLTANFSNHIRKITDKNISLTIHKMGQAKWNDKCIQYNSTNY